MVYVQNKIEESNEHISTFSGQKEVLYQNHAENLENAKKVLPNKLIDREIEFVKNFFEDKNSKNRLEKSRFEEIDAILTKLLFFNKLDVQVRMGFYKNASYDKVPSGTTIFRYGDYGDLMYVILRGACAVKIPPDVKCGDFEPVTKVTLYDGHHFGELGMAKPKKKSEGEVRTQYTTLEDFKEEIRSRINTNTNSFKNRSNTRLTTITEESVNPFCNILEYFISK